MCLCSGQVVPKSCRAAMNQKMMLFLNFRAPMFKAAAPPLFLHQIQRIKYTSKHATYTSKTYTSKHITYTSKHTTYTLKRTTYASKHTIYRSEHSLFPLLCRHSSHVKHVTLVYSARRIRPHSHQLPADLEVPARYQVNAETAI